MILGQDVLRLLTVKALKGRTWAGGRVYDSPAQAADLKIEEERAPFIGVYTDDADADTQDDSLHNPDARVYLTIECAVADQIVVAPAGPDANAHAPPGGPHTTTLAQTDSGLELSIGFLSQQALQALLAVDILDLDTPGGEANGAFEAAQAVRDVAARKPVIAIANGMAASAGYALASGATQIIAAPSGDQRLDRRGAAASRLLAPARSRGRDPDPDLRRGAQNGRQPARRR